MDVEETQTAVVENCSQRREEDDFTKELMEGAAQAALGDVVLSLRAQLQAQQFLLQNMNGTVEEAVNNAVTTLASDLHDRMQSWEGRHRWHGMHGTKCRDGGEDAIAHGKICGGRVLKSTWTNLEEP